MSGKPRQRAEANAQPGEDPHAATARAPRQAAAAPNDASGSTAQRNARPETAAIPVPPETSSVTQHSIRLDSRKIDYTATAGNLLLRDRTGEANASVFYVAYTVASKTPATRPVTFLFNGGPGAGRRHDGLPTGRAARSLQPRWRRRARPNRASALAISASCVGSGTELTSDQLATEVKPPAVTVLLRYRESLKEASPKT